MPRYSLNAFGRKIPLADTSEPLSKQVGRRLQGQPDTKIDSGGSVNSFTFDGQEISSSELREIREIRESGGVISALMRSKALLTFGAGVSFEIEENESTLQEVNGRELTLEEYLRDRLNDIDSLVLELGEDALYYPYSVAEPLENRRGGFGGIAGVEPYTVIPETDEYGDIVRWVQTTENGEQDMFAPDELVHFPLNKSSARDKTGISSILRSREEIEQFRANQQAIKSAIELHGFPQRHVKVGREGSAPIRDNELRRVRNLFDSQTVDSDTVFVTGNDVEIDALEAENFEFERVSENDMRQLSLALGVPLELTNYGSDGLGSGKPAEFRLNLFKLQIKANQRQFANIFVRDLLRPVLRDMTPYNHTVNINMEFGDPLQTEKDMATLLQEIGGYMTNAEISERFDLPKPEDEEIAESYQSPAQVEQQENQPDAGGAGEGLFSQLRELNTPQGVPDNAQYLPPGESPPEGATTYPSEGEGKYYVPADEDPEQQEGNEVTADPEEITDFDQEAVEEGDEIIIEGPDGEEHQVSVEVKGSDNAIVVEDDQGTREVIEPNGETRDGQFEAVGQVGDKDTQSEETEDTSGIEVSPPDQLPEPREVVDAPLSEGGLRERPEDASPEELAEAIPTIDERFGEELEGVPIEPDLDMSEEDLNATRNAMGQMMSRFKDDELLDQYFSRQSHILGQSDNTNRTNGSGGEGRQIPGEGNPMGNINVTNPSVSDRIVYHEQMHTIHSAFGYNSSGESAGASGGFQDYDSPISENPEGKSIESALARHENDDAPVLDNENVTELMESVEVDENGNPETRSSAEVGEVLNSEVEGDGKERLRKFVNEANKAFLKTQGVKEREGKTAAQRMVKKPYMMSNTNEFMAVTNEMMQKGEGMHVKKMAKSHPELINTYLSVFDVPEETQEELDFFRGAAE